MKKEYNFKFQDKVFQIILEKLDMEKKSNKYPLISFSLFRTDYPDNILNWKGYLEPLPEEFAFNLSYMDQINIKGSINLFESKEIFESKNKKKYYKEFIFLNLQYGLQYAEHFEGNLLEIGTSPD